jgi:hypothetical protein
MSARLRTAFLAVAFVAWGVPAQAQTAASRWLDAKPVANWNKPGMAIPRGPKSGYAEEIADCEKRGAEERPKPTVTAETRQVTAAGWLGAVVEKTIGDTVIVSARNGVDGMCRPMDYQYFVFVGGKFAGTLSPRPMHSRIDGSGWLEEKPQAKRFTVDFARYRKDDALCCPARTSTVTYELREGPRRPARGTGARRDEGRSTLSRTQAGPPATGLILDPTRPPVALTPRGRGRI